MWKPSARVARALRGEAVFGRRHVEGRGGAGSGGGEAGHLLVALKARGGRVFEGDVVVDEGRERRRAVVFV